MHVASDLAAPLLATKIHVPPVRESLLPRPRLARRLEEGLRPGTRLVLISAPAGYGKTTLLGEWIRGGRRRVGWVSLDEGDSDPARFWAYFVAALRTVWPAMDPARAETPLSAGPSSVEAFLTDLLNEMAAEHVACGLVLDDYHLITAQAVHGGLAFLLDHLPPKVQLIITSRADPPLPLARLRARGELVELRAADLSFTPEEAATLLNRVMDLGLSSEDVATVEARTEGWAVGLQLAALSLQGRPDRRSLVAGLSGGHHFILDYLMAEVLSGQPESVRSFLLQTAVLDSLSGALCNAVTGRSDGQEMLERLEAANLFVVPLDDERRWYRYHYLFATSLRSRLAREWPDLVPALHRRASEWHAREGLMPQAFRHALAGGDVARAAALAERSVGAMLGRGELTTILEWVAALPKEVARSRTALLCAQGWALYLTGQPGAAEAHLQSSEQVLRQRLAGAATAEEQRDIAAGLGDIALLRLFLARYREGPERAAELAREALTNMSEQRRGVRGQIYLSLGLALAESGAVAEAVEAHAEALRLLSATGVTTAGATAASQLARLLGLQGRLREAAEVCRQALRPGAGPAGARAGHVTAPGLIHMAMADVLYEWNELEAAERHAQEGIDLGRPGGYVEILRKGYLMLARVKQARGDVQGAQDADLALEQVMRRVEDLRSVATVASQRARLALAQGGLEAAERSARGAPSAGLAASAELREYHAITLARLLIAQGRACPGGPHLAEAVRSLERLLEDAEAGGRVGRAIEILLLQALALQAQAQRDAALATIERALALAEPEGYVRTFADEGEPARALLRPLASRSPAQGYARRLLSAFGREGARTQAWPAAAPRGAHPRAGGPLSPVEPLSEREIDVLRLIVAGLSSERIAQELYLSVNTVKTHTRSIYGKLSVHSRAQAIRRATELHLV